MVKILEDYLHLYFGCKVEYGYEGREKIGRLIGKVCPFGWQVDQLRLISPHLNVDSRFIRLFLRPLSSIAKEDIDLGDFILEYDIIIQPFTGGYVVELDSVHNDGYMITIYPDGSMNCVCKDNSEQYPFHGGDLFRQLLSKGFDLFDLIPAGLAIDSTLLNPKANG